MFNEFRYITKAGQMACSAFSLLVFLVFFLSEPENYFTTVCWGGGENEWNKVRTFFTCGVLNLVLFRVFTPYSELFSNVPERKEGCSTHCSVWQS